MSTNREPAETLQWIKDWRDDLFSSTSRDQHGWPIEMHGLASSYEELAAEVEQLRAKADCGGVNCGKCQQCLLVNEHFLKLKVEQLRAERGRLLKLLHDVLPHLEGGHDEARIWAQNVREALRAVRG